MTLHKTPYASKKQQPLDVPPLHDPAPKPPPAELPFTPEREPTAPSPEIPSPKERPDPPPPEVNVFEYLNSG